MVATAGPRPAHHRATTRALLKATHPLPALAVTSFATALTIDLATTNTLATATTIIVAVAAGQASVGWSNDWLDATRDRAAGRRDKPAATGAITPRALATAAITALAISTIATLTSGRPGTAHLAALALAWAYNLRLKATPWSWLPYATAFPLLAVYVFTALGAPAPAPWILATCALLGTGAHLANALPDLDDDAATGIRGLPHRLGPTRTALAAPTLLTLATLCPTLAGPPDTFTILITIVALTLAAAATITGLRTTHRRQAFGYAMLVAACSVIQIIHAT